jgi:hypothetical protein
MYSGTDDVGKFFNYTLKEQLTRSGVFQYSTNDEGLALIIASVKVTEYDSAIAITLISRTKDYGDFCANQWVFAVGDSRTDDMAKLALADLNDVMDQWKSGRE